MLIRKITSWILILSLVFAVCDITERKDTPGNEAEVIEELIADYAENGGETGQYSDDLFAELSSEDPVLADKWQNIFNSWDYVNSGLVINSDVLPEGLDDSSALCIVVLGFQLNPDGSMQQELIDRLEVALASAQRYPNAYIVCTGGGTAYLNPDATEARQMARWLGNHGILRSRIIVEGRSLSTAQNAMFTYQLLQERYPQVNQIAVVSSDYHIATGTLVFEAWAELIADEPGCPDYEVVSNASCFAQTYNLNYMFQAGALYEMVGNPDRANDMYRVGY